MKYQLCGAEKSASASLSYSMLSLSLNVNSNLFKWPNSETAAQLYVFFIDFYSRPSSTKFYKSVEFYSDIKGLFIYSGLVLITYTLLFPINISL